MLAALVLIAAAAATGAEPYESVLFPRRRQRRRLRPAWNIG